MKSIIASALWQWLILLFAFVFIAWSLALIVAVNRQQDGLSAGVSEINKLNALAGAIRAFEPVTAADSGAAQWRTSYERYQTQREKFTAVHELQEFMARLDTSLRRVEKIYAGLSLADNKSAALEFYRERDRAIDAVQEAVQQRRAGLARISSSLAIEWRQLNVLVLVSCFSAIGCVLLFRALRHDLGKRAQTEETLRQSEGRNRAILQAIPDLMFVLDQDGVYLDYNAPDLGMLLVPPGQFLGKNMREVLPAELAEKFFAAFAQLRQTGNPRIVEYSLTMPEGTRYYETCLAVLEGDKILSIVRDITARKQAEEEVRRLNAELEQRVIARTGELQESEARYRNLVENSPDTIFVHREGKILYINPAGARLVGAERPQQLLGKSVFKSLPSSYHQLFMQRMRMVIEQGKTAPLVEMQARRLDGSHIDVEVMGLPFVEQGRPAVQAIMRNITARKQAEAKLRESEEHFRQLAENINEVFWLDAADLSGTLYISPAFELIWGRSRESLYENPQIWQEAIHPEDRERVRPILQNWLETGKRETYGAEYRIQRPDGTLRWIWNRAFPIRNAAGEIYRIAGIAEDITARKDLEEQLQQHTENLEKLVEARAQRIRQLEKLQVESEKLAATGRMAARIAHEVNNPLAGIQGAFQLVKNAIPGDHKYYVFVTRIENEIEYIARIIRQMFDLHQPEKDAVRRFRFDDAIQDILALVKAGLRESNVAVDHDVQPATFEATMHQNLLRQILYNVVQNAIDASPAGGIVKLTVIGEAARVTITIADQGPGIPEEVRSRIFEPFFTTKSGFSKSGLGLGLSVSRSIVESMGGTIDFESKMGEGTVFRIIVPIANDVRNSLSNG